MKKIVCGLLTGLLVTATVFAGGAYSYKRAYRIGNSYDYRLTTNTFHNGKLVSTSEARSHFLVVRRHGIPSTRVTFVGFKVTTPKAHGAYQVLDNFAREVKPFYLSLAPGGTLSIPKLAVPHMTGPLTDLVTYWVAMSPKAGVGFLHRVGDRHTLAVPFGGKWSNGRSVLVGRDELRVSSTLESLSARSATYRIVFSPPENAALTMAHAWMAKPVALSKPNNFEQISPEGGGKFFAMWGHEDFTITSTVDQATGMILSATMVNNLDVKLRVQCDKAFTTCGPEIPFSIKREEKLTLLSHA